MGRSPLVPFAHEQGTVRHQQEHAHGSPGCESEERAVTFGVRRLEAVGFEWRQQRRCEEAATFASGKSRQTLVCQNLSRAAAVSSGVAP